MALKDTWEDLQDKVQGDPDSGSDISVDFNSIWKVKEEDQLDESSRLDKDDDNELKNEGQEVGTEEKTPSETSEELPQENNEEEKA